MGFVVFVCTVYEQSAISCKGFRRRTGTKPYGDLAEIVRKSCSHRAVSAVSYGNHTEPMRLPYGGRAEITVTVQSSCRFRHSCTKSVQLHISACVVGEMAPKTWNEKRYKKDNVDPSQGGHTVMERSPWDYRKITALYPYGHCTGTVRQPCDSYAGAVRLSQELAYNHHTSVFAQMTI